MRNDVARIVLLLSLLSAARPALAAEPAGTGLLLARDGKAALPIVISAKASPEIRKVADELAATLKQMTGAAFEVAAGDGAAGIVLGTLEQFPCPDLARPLEIRDGVDGREAYAIRTEPRRLLLLGAADLGASHAAFRFLETQGCRWLFPAPEWTVVPAAPALRVDVNESSRPAYLSRRIWYGWGFFDRQSNDDYQAWARHNRMAASLRIHAGHAWEGIIAGNRKVFEAHPEYLALVKDAKTGKAERKGEKFCLANQDLRKLVVDQSLAYFEKNPASDMVSVECSDGGGHCQCDACAKLGTVSDGVFGLANEVAKAVAAKYPGKWVGLLAYNVHSEPPSFDLEPNVYVQLTTAFTVGRYTFAELSELWPKKCRHMGFYDYFSVFAWDHDTFPGGGGANVGALAEKIRRFAALHATSLDAESGNNWGLHGRGYVVANRLMWDPKADPDAILADFYDKAFGPAAAPMRRYYERVDPGTKPLWSEHLLALAFRDVEEAARLAQGRPDVLARIDHVRIFLRSVHLRWRLDRTKDPAERKPVALELLTHVYRTRRTYMNHWEAIRQSWTPDLAKAFSEPSWSFSEKGAHPWAVETAYTREEIEKNFQEGLAAFKPQAVTEKEFSGDLVPVSFAGAKEAPTRHAYQGGLRYWLYSLKGEPVAAQVVTGTIAWYRDRADARFAFRDPAGKVLAEGRLPLDGKPHDLTADVPRAGLYALDFEDTSAGWVVTVEAGRPAAIPLRREKGYSHAGHMPPTYFYVPKGTREISYYWSGGPHTVRGPDGAVVRKVETSGAFVAIPVPEGADGKPWHFTELALGHLWFFNIPNVLAASPGALLLPREVAARDGLAIRTGP
jgi:hypothetical protein